MLKSKLLLVIVVMLSLVIGFVLSGYLQSYSCIAFDNKINIGLGSIQVFSFLGTFLMAIYVARVLSKKNEFEKENKKLLIEYFVNFEKHTRESVSEIIEKDLFYQPAANACIKRIRQRLSHIDKIVEQNKILHQDIDKRKMADLRENIHFTWDYLTGDKLEDRKHKAHSNLIELENIIFQIVMDINRFL